MNLTSISAWKDFVIKRNKRMVVDETFLRAIRKLLQSEFIKIVVLLNFLAREKKKMALLVLWWSL